MRRTQTVAAGLLILLAVASAGDAANITFVGDVDGDAFGDGNVPANVAADTSMINHLTSVLGHTVTIVDDSVVTAAAVAGADFIVVSATASSGTYATSPAPDGNTGAINSLGTSATIVLMEGGNQVLSRFQVNTQGALVPYPVGTIISILANDGYVTAGLPLGSLTIYNASSTIGTWGSVAPQAANFNPIFAGFDYLGTALASVPDTGFPISDVAVGVHTLGDNKIVLLPFHLGSFTNLNANGIKLFNNVFVPEPSSALLAVLGALALVMIKRRR